MAKSHFTSVDEYLAVQPEEVLPILEQVRAAIRTAVPAAEEVISYQIPAYELHGHVFLFFAGWKRHYSLYPADERLIEAFKDDLEPYEVNDKGTIRFPLSQPVPVELIGRIAEFRAADAAAEAPTDT